MKQVLIGREQADGVVVTLYWLGGRLFRLSVAGNGMTVATTGCRTDIVASATRLFRDRSGLDEKCDLRRTHLFAQPMFRIDPPAGGLRLVRGGGE